MPPPSRWRGWRLNRDRPATEPDLLRHFRAALRIGRCDHGVVRSQIPTGAIFVDAEPVLHLQMPAQHLGAKPAVQAHHIILLHRAVDWHRRLWRRGWRGA